MTPIDRILTEGDITWRLDRGWHIVEADGSLWWHHPYAAAFGSDRACRPTMVLTDHETEVWEAMRPKEDPVNWTRSSQCKTDHVTGNCVEAAINADGLVLLRDSRTPDVVLVLDPGDWDAFLGGVAAGDFAELPTLTEP